MNQHYSRPNAYFWLLTISASILVGFGFILTWYQGQAWLNTLWHLCQAQLRNFDIVWQLIVPIALLAIVLRGLVSIIRQVRATARLNQAFYPWRQTPSARLQTLLTANHLTKDQVVFLKLSSPRAFCAGFWRPRIWLTAGIVELLTDEELAAVLAHEAHHCRRRDPLRLVISRVLKSTFFFLPVVSDLAQAVELQQEIAADQAAIARLGDDLPLLCAIQKLLQRGALNASSKAAAYTPFNVTEARLRRLIAAPAPTKWRLHLFKWAINLGIIAILSTVVVLSIRPATAQQQITSCTSEPDDNFSSRITWLDYNL